MSTEPAKLIQNAKNASHSFSQWVAEKLEPLARAAYPLELSAWRKELALIQSLVEQPDRVRIALVGTTGAGKSTFLNAVLGQEVLPVGVMNPCTAFVTAVSHSAEPGYQVTVRFCNRQEWQSDLESLVASLSPGEEGDEGDGRGESKRLMAAARKRVQAVYGVPVEAGGNPSDLLKAHLPPEAERIFAAGSLETNHFGDAKEMQVYLKKLIRGESSLWPLVKQVDVSGPYQCLAGGLELVDLPGLNDPNEARVEVTREFLRTSPFVWVVFSMVRGLTEDIQRILREEKLLRTLVLSGTYGSLSLVGTKADDIDTNMAEQLGLPDDCTQADLVRAYMDQTVGQARNQLEQMVRDLASHNEGGETLTRMIEVARRVRVHATSASAYNKLEGVGLLRKDYGITDVGQTGIPGVRDHLADIGKQAGAVFNARTALNRLDRLRDEITFFFRARAKAPTPELDQARARFQDECAKFCGEVRSFQSRANDQLKLRRQHFLAKMDPLFKTSVQGIRHATQRWGGTHWATLRAIVQRDGSFKSPTTGRNHDFNEDLAEPLLGQLPVSWEQYFTDDLGRVTDEFVVRVTESGKNFCGRVRLIVDLLFHHKDQGMEKQLAWFQDKVSLLADAANNRVVTAVRERRSELAAKMPLVARGRMQPSYNAAKGESGTGMKRRMLAHLEPAAVASAQPIYSTIQSDLLEGLNDLELIIVGMLRDLTGAAEEQARIVSHNANIDVGEVAADPVISALLESIPK